MNVHSGRLEKVRDRIARACVNAGRNPNEIRIMAVSKTHPAEAIRALNRQGQSVFGENRLQEALQKQCQLTDLDLEWHFIGPVQSNKTRDLATCFDWVQSVDREKILRRLASQRPESAGPLNICLQVNIDREPQKAGVLPEALDDLVELAGQLDSIRLRGLMAIPRLTEDPAETRASFRAVRNLYDRLLAQRRSMDTLSMGMSADLEMAIAEGSTMIRVGTDLFGPRGS